MVALANIAFLFLFYRIMTAAMFDDPMSLIACLILSIINGLVMVAGSSIGLAWALDELIPNVRYRISWLKLFGAWIVIVAVCFLAGWLISLGFSERFFEEINDSGYRRDFFEQNWFWFLITIAIPITVQLTLMASMFKKSL